MRKLHILQVFLLVFINLEIHGQFYNTGSAPFSVKYRQINTDEFRLIYPKEAEQMAQEFASDLQQLVPYTSHSLNHKPVNIDIILHNQSVLSNGYVVWAPKRMEVVSTSPQETYAHDWLEQLALHEYRHVVQVDKLNQGFTKGLSYLFGEMGSGAIMGFLPLWYLEGDAVVNETALASTGRGRDPEFIQEVMAVELEREKRLKYDEFYLGTYKDYAPSHYHFGYQMVAWSRMKYGPELWSRVIDNVGRRPFTMAPFYLKLNRETGLSKVSLYDSTMNFLHNVWDAENKKLVQSDTDEIKTNFKSRYVSYQFPYMTSEGSVLALRSSIDDIDKLVEIKDGKEKVLQRIGYFRGSKVSYSEKYIAWEEVHYDPRWERKDYSVIRIYNRETGKSEILKIKEKHFAPEISPDEEQICLIKNDEIYDSYLEIYNISSKHLVKRIRKGENQLSFPTWLSDNRLAVIFLTTHGKGIAEYNLQTQEWKTILQPGFENISYLHGNENELFFTYSLSGRSNIYRLNLQNNALHKITEEHIGGNYASVSDSSEELYYSSYTSEGYKPRSVSLSKGNFSDAASIRPYHYLLAEANAAQELINIQDSILPLRSYESTPYKKGWRWFKVHSWLLPFYIDMDALLDQQLEVSPGIMLFSQNSLSTVTSTIAYYYQDGYHHLKPKLSFKMIYPVISFDYLIGGPPKLYSSNVEFTSFPDDFSNYSEFNTEISLPLRFSTSQYTLTTEPSIKHRYRNVYVADSNSYDNIEFTHEDIHYYKGYTAIDYRFSFYVATKMASKNLRPKWGFYYYISHLTPRQHDQYWSENTVQFLTLYLPGFFRHHSTRALLGNEKGFGGRLSLARGYTYKEDVLFDYEEANKLVLEYSLPLLYPNLSLGPIAYFKRIHANLYYDYFKYSRDIHNFTFSDKLQSVGLELGFETNFLRFFWTFVPTLQYNYRIEDNSHDLGYQMTTQMSFALGGIPDY
jgi:hypothetical protein